MKAVQKILVIDDELMFRELQSLFLAHSGDVITASDGAEGLALARHERPDVVVVDLSMPGMGGEAVCKEIKADPDLRNTPVIVVTGGAVAEDRARAVHAGADDLIAKPISRLSLIRAVKRFEMHFPAVRGLPRVTIAAPVRLLVEEREARGTGRNISRGGIFVESGCIALPGTVVQLEFQLPDETHAFSPTARVIWQRERQTDGARGMGMQFLAMDSTSARRIDDFVYEHTPTVRNPDPD